MSKELRELPIAIAGPVEERDGNIFRMDRGKLQRLAYERGERIVELEAELKTHDWTAVEDGLPEVTSDTLILHKCGSIETAYFNGKEWFNRTEITHWRKITLPREVL